MQCVCAPDAWSALGVPVVIDKMVRLSQRPGWGISNFDVRQGDFQFLKVKYLPKVDSSIGLMEHRIGPCVPAKAGLPGTLKSGCEGAAKRCYGLLRAPRPDR